MILGSIFFLVFGVVFGVMGIAMLLNIFGAADRAAAHNRRGRDDPSREPGNHPETRGGMRLGSQWRCLRARRDT